MCNKSIFAICPISNFILNERVSIVEVQFDIKGVDVPPYEAWRTCLRQIPERDNYSCAFNDIDDGYFDSKHEMTESDYNRICSELEEQDLLSIQIEINKNVRDGRFSVYSFERFTNDLASLPIDRFLAVFASFMIGINDKLTFEVLDQEISLTTETIRFQGVHALGKEIFDSKDSGLDRAERLKAIEPELNLEGLKYASLLPEDFHVKQNSEENILIQVFEKMETLLSINRIVFSTWLSANEFQVCVQEKQLTKFSYPLKDIKNNIEWYKIYKWACSGGNTTDKVLIARNVIARLMSEDIFNLSESVMSSIESNFTLYLKQNVDAYLKVRNELAGFISDVVIHTSEYSLRIFNGLKKTLAAIVGFAVTVVLTNVVSVDSMQDVFTKDIVFLLEVLIGFSLLYLVICWTEVSFNLKSIDAVFKKLKGNYENVLSASELKEIFDDDKILREMIRNVKKWRVAFCLIWVLSVVIMVVALENYTGYFIIGDPVYIWLQSCWNELRW